MADTQRQICGEKDCVLYTDERGPTYAPAGTPFAPGVVIGRFTDDPTPDPELRIDPPLLIGFFFLLVAAFAANRFRKSIGVRPKTTGSE